MITTIRTSYNANRWQAVELDDAGQVATACGHDDHRTRRDARQCESRIATDSGSTAVWLLVAPLVVMVIVFAAQLAGAMAGAA